MSSQNGKWFNNADLSHTKNLKIVVLQWGEGLLNRAVVFNFVLDENLSNSESIQGDHIFFLKRQINQIIQAEKMEPEISFK